MYAYCPPEIHTGEAEPRPLTGAYSPFIPVADVETKLKLDRLMRPHYRYYVREMRILAYTQLLESYQSLTLQYMADAFGVSVDFIDQ